MNVGYSLKVVDTDRLLVEYVKLPIGDLTVTVLYRIVEPIPLIWKMMEFTIMEVVHEPDFIERLKQKCVKEWRNALPDDPNIPENWKTGKIELVECEIVPIKCMPKV